MRGQPILRIQDDRKTKERELKEKNEIKLGIRDQPYHAATYAKYAGNAVVPGLVSLVT